MLRTNLTWTLTLTLAAVPLFAIENSILYPRQIQPKPPSPREQCTRNEAWRRYGSLSECLAEKRHEELTALQTERRQVERERAARNLEAQEEIREELRRQREQHSTERFIDESNELIQRVLR